MKALIRYPGSKWRLAGRITRLFPKHHSYLEPYFGSGAVLFSKKKSDMETVNDLDNNVVNLFEWIRKDPEKLAHEIYYTPYARQVYDEAYASVPADSLGRAVNFCIRLNMGYGFRTNDEKTGWKIDVQGRERSYASLEWRGFPERIMQAAERLRGVQIENRPALELIQKFNYENVLIYCDPPYMLSTRHGKQYYRNEMKDTDHEELMAALLKHKGHAAVSGYDTKLYNSMLAGWNKYEMTSCSRVRAEKKEILWMNYELLGRQLEFEDMAEWV